MDENNNLAGISALSSDLNTRGKIAIQLEELLVAGNYDEAKLLLEPSQPVDVADAIGGVEGTADILSFSASFDVESGAAGSSLSLAAAATFFGNTAAFDFTIQTDSSLHQAMQVDRRLKHKIHIKSRIASVRVISFVNQVPVLINKLKRTLFS